MLITIIFSMDGVKCRAPMRISFAGGGTDVPPFSDEYGGAVLNTAIAKYAYTTIKPIDHGLVLKSLDYLFGIEYKDKEELAKDGKIDLLKAALKNYAPQYGGMELSFFSDALPRSGLGASASAFVSLLTALNRAGNLDMTKKKIAEEAWKLEREELGNIGGKQDQYASAFGGINFIEFNGDKVDISPLRIDGETALELERRIILFHYKARESSGNILEKQVSNVKEKKKETIDALLRVKEIAKEMKGHLLDGNVNEIGALMDEGWKMKKKFSDNVSNPEVDQLYSKLREKGVLGGKISGAGGGGHMFVVCDENKVIDTYQYIMNSGYSPSFLKIDLRGVVVW